MQVSFLTVEKRKLIFSVLVHTHRLIYDYENYTYIHDVSAPAMINTQKLTALAVSFKLATLKLKLVMPTSTTQQTQELDSSDKYHPKTVQPSTFWPVFNLQNFLNVFYEVICL